MGLPKVNTPEYTLTIPSTDEELKFRPFLVQEEKLLLIAQQTGTEKAVMNAIRQLVENCCFGKLDIDKMIKLRDINFSFDYYIDEVIKEYKSYNKEDYNNE